MERIMIGLIRSKLHPPSEFIYFRIVMGSNLSSESHLCVTIVV